MSAFESSETQALDVSGLSTDAIAELRSDHAGETGAVYIYLGLLAISKDPILRQFADAHLATEQRHLMTLDGLLPKHAQSKCLPLWRLAGWSLGAIAALGGRPFAYTTIQAVETFVVEHYQQQLHLFPAPLRPLLESFCADEAHHRDEARLAAHPGSKYRLWHWLVTSGSAAAVGLARRL